MRKYFGTDGIRGKANVFPMTASFALRLGQAAAQQFKNGKKTHRIVVGKDTRVSGYMFENALVAGICSMGVDAVQVGVIPTPAIAFITRSLRADAGVVISASHNPYYDNGIKFFSSEGLKLPDEVELAIEQKTDSMVHGGEVSISAENIGKAYRIDTAVGRYVEFVKSSLDKDLDLMGMKIVMDCAHGSAYRVAPMAMMELGANVTTIGVEPNGTNINDGVGSVHPEKSAELVKKQGADVGISFDGDADRVIFVDEKGEVVDGDIIMGICARQMKLEGRLSRDTLVATVMSNYGFEKSMNGIGINIERCAVGDRYVLAKMLEGGYNIGGEQSGHMIFSDYNTTGDGMISAIQLLKVMRRTGKPLSELKQFIELFPQVLINEKVEKKIPLDELTVTSALIKSVEEKLKGRGRVLVRYSGTENKIRVMTEGYDHDEITSMARDITDTIVKEIGKK
ncbi:phosphoglucosamine mutase [Geovibrio thiophilus]|uniref:Phosphoglucosamine mutase n=1 Tax=Geovibrio thiophilus TaxID=139438 RepID=A0A410JY00_9BACT|nr:phosphoglucosamine mutase [Geovibrio thiophilus]QAR33040.1 phosphoglucosamine mutase [Geovibrio thiophilus]